jgi:adenosylhomocysteine nucleosidase
MRKFNILFITCCLFFLVPVSSFSQLPVTGIIGAMELEVNMLKQQLQQEKDTTIQNLHFYTGTLKGRHVVIARCGVGKVNAAIVTTLLIEHFKPAHILFSGIAGGLNPSLHPGDVILASKIGYHDYGRKFTDHFENWATSNPSTFGSNPEYFVSDSLLLLLAKNESTNILLKKIGNNTPAIHTGTILTGDVFLSDGVYGAALKNKTGADAVEMEGAAVAQTAWQQGVPFLIIRSLSDSANDEAALDFSKYGTIAAENSAAIILKILGQL